MFLGPIYAPYLLVTKGKVYAQNYGFAPGGPFGTRVWVVACVVWWFYIYTTYLLLSSKVFGKKEEKKDHYGISVYPYIVMVF